MGGKKGRRFDTANFEDVSFMPDANPEGWRLQFHGLPQLSAALLLELWPCLKRLSPEA